MTLEEAIEEVRAGNVRRWGVVDTKPTAVATILNAVASGQLVPKDDAALAVAEALRKAGEAVKQAQDADTAWGHIDHTERILALANQDHLAEVQALRTERDEAFRCAMMRRERLDAAEAEVARLSSLMSERSQMLQGYDRMLKESAAREEHWKALYQAALTPKGDTP